VLGVFTEAQYAVPSITGIIFYSFEMN
jgi:hypothetical protein